MKYSKPELIKLCSDTGGSFSEVGTGYRCDWPDGSNIQCGHNGACEKSFKITIPDDVLQHLKDHVIHPPSTVPQTKAQLPGTLQTR